MPDSQRAAEIARLREAHAHLAVANSQSIAEDDQIIMGHLRAALAILEAELAGYRAEREASNV